MTPPRPVHSRAAPLPGRPYPQLVAAVDTVARAERIRAGDGEAFEDFFRELYPPLVAFLRHRTGSSAVAEDVAQDAFVALWARRTRIDPARSLRAYLFRTAVNAVASQGRRRRLEQRVRDWLRLGERHAAPADEALATDELRDAIRTAVQALPPRCREVFLLARDAHMSYAEIAQVLRLSTKTVENHMGRALRRLRDALEPFRR